MQVVCLDARQPSGKHGHRGIAAPPMRVGFVRLRNLIQFHAIEPRGFSTQSTKSGRNVISETCIPTPHREGVGGARPHRKRFPSVSSSGGAASLSIYFQLLCTGSSTFISQHTMNLELYQRRHEAADCAYGVLRAKHAI